MHAFGCHPKALSKHAVFKQKDTLKAGNKLKQQIDTLNPKNQQNMFVIKKHTLFYIIINQIL